MSEAQTENEAIEFDNSNEAGAIWIRENQKKQQQLSIVIDGEQINGFLNERKGENQKAPDFNLVQYVDGKAKNVGAAWIGTSQKGNSKLSIRLKTDGKDCYYTAVKRANKPEGSKAADMTVFVPTTSEVIEAAKKAEESRVDEEKKEPATKKTENKL